MCIRNMAAVQVGDMLDAIGLDTRALVEMIDACSGISSISDNKEFQKIMQFQIDSIIQDAK